MIDYIYRLRSTESLLGKYKELENQEVYFAKPIELNDPVEGFKNMFWFGDKVVWKNFLKHYLLCLEHICLLSTIGGEEYPIDSSHIPVFKTENDLPTQQYKDMYQEICQLFFAHKIISKYPEYLSFRKNPLRRNELYFYLRMLHFYALDTILTVYENYRHINKRPKDDAFRQAGTKGIIDFEKIDANNLEQEHPDIEDITEQFYAAANETFFQLELAYQYNNPTLSNFKNRRLIITEFPEKYLKQLEKIVHPDWYVAAFSANCNNPSMWGHYGDNHRGVCLKFKADLVQDKPAINLHGIIGWGDSKEESGPIYGDRDCPFYKVNYTGKYPEVDFFRSLGCLPGPALTWWYLDENSNKSSCNEDVYKDVNQWREKYWSDLQKNLTIKLEDWSYEEEYRLILYGNFTDYGDVAKRKLKYHFKDLEGIIFGVNTSEQDKLSIMKIIENKCRNEKRQDFKFYQAYYSRKTGKIENTEWRLLNFKL